MTRWIVCAVVVSLLVYLGPPTPRALGRLLKRLVGYIGVLAKAKRNRTDLLGWIVRRPALVAANYGGEIAQIAMNGVDTRLKVLAGVKTSSIAGCPF
jgi:hypothetical protein